MFSAGTLIASKQKLFGEVFLRIWVEMLQVCRRKVTVDVAVVAAAAAAAVAVATALVVVVVVVIIVES
jgi:hypothetical protein